MIEITAAPIDANAVADAVRSPDVGAVVVFEGTARDHHAGRRVITLEYEAWPEMAQQELERITDETRAKWHGVRVAVVHRTGVVPMGEAAVVIATSSPHREEAYASNRFLIEQLKLRLPVWKKEIYEDGSAWQANAPAREPRS